MKLSIYVYLVPTLRISAAILLLPVYSANMNRSNFVPLNIFFLNFDPSELFCLIQQAVLRLTQSLRFHNFRVQPAGAFISFILEFRRLFTFGV